MIEYVIKKFEAKNSLIAIQGLSIFNVFNKKVGADIITDGCFYCLNGQVTYFTNEKDYKIGRDWILDQLRQDSNWGKQFYLKTKQRLEQFSHKSINLLNQTDFKVNKETVENYLNEAMDVVSLSYFTDWFSYKANEWIKDLIDLSDEDFLVLMSPKELSFVNKYQAELAKSRLNGWPTAREIEENYFWVEDNYSEVHRLDQEKIQETIDSLSVDESKNILKVKPTRVNKNEIYQKIGADSYTRSVFELLADFIELQDTRKKVCLLTNNVASRYFEELLNKSGVDNGDRDIILENAFSNWFYQMSTDELLDKSKEASTGIMLKTNGQILYGGEAKKEYENLLHKDQGEIKGFVAFRGRVRGVIKVINKIADFEKLNDGEILVSSMTRPDMMPILKKASAFITDEGGITCHAAIVSREMKKPCIIGTKIATKVLKDGDFVEVDAEKGIVRKLIDPESSSG